MNIGVKSISDMTFRPERFFLGQTTGCGLARDPFGKVIHRFAVTTRGARTNTYGAIQIDHTCIFDNGEIEVMSWLITEAVEGRYVVAEPQLGSDIMARAVDDDFEMSFKRKFKSRFGRVGARFQSRMSLLEPELAVANNRVSVLGAPLGTMTTFHRKVGV